MEAEAAEEETEEEAGYRIKNKNPTKRCGEKQTAKACARKVY
jgi:8-oxo-dGTP pyrophosphatase MutT (NUDIX family)